TTAPSASGRTCAQSERGARDSDTPRRSRALHLDAVKSRASSPFEVVTRSQRKCELALGSIPTRAPVPTGANLRARSTSGEASQGEEEGREVASRPLPEGVMIARVEAIPSSGVVG